MMSSANTGQNSGLPSGVVGPVDSSQELSLDVLTREDMKSILGRNGAREKGERGKCERTKQGVESKDAVCSVQTATVNRVRDDLAVTRPDHSGTEAHDGQRRARPAEMITVACTSFRELLGKLV